MRPILLAPSVRLAMWLAVCTLGSGAAVAQTFVVDDDGGPGVDFSTIVDALAVVPDRSTLDIRAGSYDGFTLERPLSMVGASPDAVFVSGQITIDGANVDDVIKLAGIRCYTFYFQDVSQTLLLEDVKCDSFNSGEIRGVRCDDLRFQNLNCRAPVSLFSSKASFYDSTLFCNTYLAPALSLVGNSTAQMHECYIEGGRGEQCGPIPGCLSGGNAGNGSPGIQIDPAARARIVRSAVHGGQMGIALCGCFLDGVPGPPAVVEGRLESWMSDYFRGLFQLDPATLVLGAGSVDLNEPIPTLSASTTGLQIDLVASSLPGSSGRIIFGRGPVFASAPADSFGLLVRPDRIASLGESPASGTQALTFTNPGWPLGTTLWLQVSQTLTNGSTRLSNPIAVVIR